jgi:hypothetical protein
MRVRDRRQHRFVIGTVLAWMPFSLLICLKSSGSFFTLVERTNGWLVVLAVVLGIAAEATAIPFLLGAFARGKWLRGAFSVVSLCCAVFMIFGFFVLLVVMWVGVSQFQPRS